MSKTAPLNIVLVEPEIPQNTGNIGRTCVGLGAALHLVGTLGFEINAREIKRSGLDYWDKLRWHRHAAWKEFEAALPPEAHLYVFSTKGERSVWDVKYEAPAYLVFGSESRGLPPALYRAFAGRLIRIPVASGIRSLNLSTAAGIAAYEAVRQRITPP
jgi:tRNA (cytidine/uridine-2'-O-)-methyltransferase